MVAPSAFRAWSPDFLNRASRQTRSPPIRAPGSRTSPSNRVRLRKTPPRVSRRSALSPGSTERLRISRLAEAPRRIGAASKRQSVSSTSRRSRQPSTLSSPSIRPPRRRSPVSGGAAPGPPPRARKRTKSPRRVRAASPSSGSLPSPMRTKRSASQSSAASFSTYPASPGRSGRKSDSSRFTRAAPDSARSHHECMVWLSFQDLGPMLTREHPRSPVSLPHPRGEAQREARVLGPRRQDRVVGGADQGGVPGLDHRAGPVRQTGQRRAVGEGVVRPQEEALHRLAEGQRPGRDRGEMLVVAQQHEAEADGARLVEAEDSVLVGSGALQHRDQLPEIRDQPLEVRHRLQLRPVGAEEHHEVGAELGVLGPGLEPGEGGGVAEGGAEDLRALLVGAEDHRHERPAPPREEEGAVGAREARRDAGGVGAGGEERIGHAADPRGPERLAQGGGRARPATRRLAEPGPRVLTPRAPAPPASPLRETPRGWARRRRGGPSDPSRRRGRPALAARIDRRRRWRRPSPALSR